MIERSPKSKSAVSVLNEDFNDIDIYVEDTAVESKKIYSEILSRTFDNKYRIDNVIPLGGCSQVIKEWRSNIDKSDNRPKAYLIDGDYHNLNDSLTKLLQGSEIDNHKGLFILPRYCIENYLLDLNSFVEIIYEENSTDDRITITSKLDFKKWIDLNDEILTDLFIYNSICINFNIKTKTSKYDYKNLLSADPGICCTNLVTTRIEELKHLIISQDASINTEEEYNIRKEKIKGSNFLVIATGKDYLFPLVKKYINNVYNHLNMSETSLKIRLSKICNIEELEHINNTIIK